MAHPAFTPPAPFIPTIDQALVPALQRWFDAGCTVALDHAKDRALHKALAAAGFVYQATEG